MVSRRCNFYVTMETQGKPNYYARLGKQREKINLPQIKIFLNIVNK